MTDQRIHNHPDWQALSPQIAAYNKKYWSYAAVGFITCLGIAVIYLWFAGWQGIKNQSFMRVLFVPLIALLLFSLSRIKRNFADFKEHVQSHVGEIPADFAMIVAAANTINSHETTRRVQQFTKYQLLSAFVAGYGIALAIPVLAYLAKVLH